MPRCGAEWRIPMPALTSSLEDYLETIYLLQQGPNMEARVRDIAAARSVKASSVSPALKRLSEMGYLAYEQREFIRLTETGKIAARRVYARHVLLFQFFHDILGMPENDAREEACGLEHALSDDGMDRFVRFFESRSICSNCKSRLCGGDCSKCDDSCRNCHKNSEFQTLDDVEDQACVTVLQIRESGVKRQTILDMGILPNVVLTRKMTTPDGVCIAIGGHELMLSRDQTKVIVVLAKEI